MKGKIKMKQTITGKRFNTLWNKRIKIKDNERRGDFQSWLQDLYIHDNFDELQRFTKTLDRVLKGNLDYYDLDNLEEEEKERKYQEEKEREYQETRKER
mgnify:FL=1